MKPSRYALRPALRAQALLVLALLALPAYAQSPATPTLAYTLTAPTVRSYDYFGYSVSGVPDVNGDGVMDLVVGAPARTSSTWYYDLGRVYVYSGATGALLYTLSGPASYDRGFGGTVAGVPDLNGDGRGDIVVDALDRCPPYYPCSYEPVYVFSGASGSFLRSYSSPWSGYSGAQFGSALAGLPDVEGDGLSEILVGAKDHDGEVTTDIGTVYNYGSEGLRSNYAADPYQSYAYFGWSVSAVSDMNADGRAELAGGAPYEDVFSVSDAGGVHFNKVYLDHPYDETNILAIYSPSPVAGGHFGYDVAGLPDINYDGVGDILTGAPGERPYGYSNAGYAYIHTPTGTGGAYHYRTLVSPNATVWGRFGQSLTGTRSAYEEADAVSEVIVGEPGGDVYYYPSWRDWAGRAHVFAADTGGLLASLTSPSPEASGQYGYDVTYLGDINGDFRSDFAVSAPFENFFGSSYPDAGKVYVYYGGCSRCSGVAGNETEGSESRDVPSEAASEAPSEAPAPPEASASAEEGLPAAPALHAPSPNPARGRAAVRFDLPAPSPVRLSVYDALGREVAVLADGTQEAGRHEATFDGSALPPGVYLVRMTTEDGFAQTARLTLIR